MYKILSGGQVKHLYLVNVCVSDTSSIISQVKQGHVSHIFNLFYFNVSAGQSASHLKSYFIFYLLNNQNIILF